MQIAQLNLSELNLHWRRRSEQEQSLVHGDRARLARRALELGEPLLACDICAESLREAGGASDDAFELRKAYGLALARSGALESARAVAGAIVAQGAKDEEAVGLLARIHKDLWQLGAGSADARMHLDTASGLYHQAYASSRGIWSGVNAATLLLVQGSGAEAARIAREIRDALKQRTDAAAADYWSRATLAECALILGEIEEAKRLYRLAASGTGDFGSLASTRRNAALILAARGLAADALASVLPAPAVLAFTGHMLDRADRAAARFSESDVPAVGARIAALLAQAEARIGYASAASGGDILFIEAMLARGAEVHIVLPSAQEHFVRDSVSREGDWLDRYGALLAEAASITVVSESASTPLAYAYVNRVILGMARLRARQIGGAVRTLALWNGMAGALGGTASAVADWQAAGQSVTCLAPRTLAVTELPPSKPAAIQAAGEGGQRIVSMLFADAVGFSKLEDRQVPIFVKHFLGSVSGLIDHSAEMPLTRNTWGDGLYFCFDTPRGAAELALKICELTQSTRWQDFQLPEHLNIRVALHAGPAYDCIDPVTHLRSFSGAHVSRAARIEPVTPPGQVYASQAFSALCECFQLSEYVCDYVGQLPLAKGYGTFPTFHLRRARVAAPGN